MAWYHTLGKEQDVVVSTRVRLARNIENFPFVSKMEAAHAEALIDKVGPILESGGFSKTDFQDISRAQAYALIERHYVSPAFVRVSLPHVLYLNEPCHLSVMLCEEDHIRLQCILPGLSVSEALDGARRVEELLDEHLDFAYDPQGRWGYLSHCPTNVGTAMRASVMMFLPALSAANRMDALAAQLAQNGLTVRGIRGEGTAATGYMYQISNRVTLGPTEQALAEGLYAWVKVVCEEERRARATMLERDQSALTDKVFRALGLLKYARVLPLKEFIYLMSDVRLGAAMGILKGPPIHELTALFIDAMPASLALSAGLPQASEEAVNAARGDLARERLSAVL